MVAPGEGVSINGSGFPATETATVRDIASRTSILGVTRVDRFGNFSLVAIIPETAPPGSHTIEATPGSTCTQAHIIVSLADPDKRSKHITGTSPMRVEVVISLGVAAALVAWWLLRALASGRRRVST